MSALALLLAALVQGTAASAATPEPATPAALLDRLEAAWQARDAPGYLALWGAADAETRDREAEFVAGAFGGGESRLLLERPGPQPGGTARLKVTARVVTIEEPRGRVDQWLFTLEERPRGWALVARDPAGRIDGLVHLSLDPAGFKARGLKLAVEDFELEMREGSLFTSPESLGPTVLVFVGEGVVRVRPTPETEREQLRQFCGKPELVESVRSAFVRIHPADLDRVLSSIRLEPDREAAGRLPAARRLFEEQVQRAFVLDAALPGSPWWVLPSFGDSLVTFPAGKRGVLTHTISVDQPEAISLFDRARRRQICLYPSSGHSTRYSEDDGRSADVLNHDIRLRFEPRDEQLEGEDTLRIRMLAPAATIRLKLDDALRVSTITSREAGRHLFFRVRNQDAVMVSLGALTGTPELALTVRYGGRLLPAPLENQTESQRAALDQPGVSEDEIRFEKVLVYSNRSAFYPQAGSDDFATATLRLDTPAGFAAVTGGERVSARSDGSRTITEYRLEQPGKYYSVAVGPLAPAGERRAGELTLRAFGVSRTRGAAAEALEQAAEILRFFTEQFGPCPYPSLNLALIEAVLPGGHSPPGMVVLARRPAMLQGQLREDPTNFSDVPGFFLAHELAHQWWGHGVAGQNYRERWLSEGTAQYAAALWIRHSRGEEAFQSVLKRMGRWALRESHQGPIHLGYRLGHVRSDPDAFRALVYDKGAYVLHMLRAVVGDEAFRTAMVTFQQRFRFAKAGTDDLRETLEAASGRQLSAYFRDWVFGTSLPLLHHSHRSVAGGAGYRTAIDVRPHNLPGPVPLEVAVVHDGGRVTRRVTLPAEGGSWTLESPGRPSRVEVNGDRGLLALTGPGPRPKG